MRLLVVDDDPKFRGYMQRGLVDCGYECVTAADADEAERVLVGDEKMSFDLVLLDVMMPGRSGWELLQDLRRCGFTAPVIFLTARHAVEERVKGLRLGADDYIIKPFEFAELLARIEVVTRRGSALPVYEVAGLSVDVAHRTVEVDGLRVEVSPREFELLHALVEAGGRTLSRAELLDRVWGIGFDPETNVVDVLVARLRRKLGPRGRDVVETVVGKGYRIRQAPKEGAP